MTDQFSKLRHSDMRAFSAPIVDHEKRLKKLEGLSPDQLGGTRQQIIVVDQKAATAQSTAEDADAKAVEAQGTATIADGKADTALTSAETADAKAQEALDRPAGGTKITSSMADPTSSDVAEDGSVWWTVDSADNIVRQFQRISGAWVQQEFTSELIAATLVGKTIVGSTIEGATINATSQLSGADLLVTNGYIRAVSNGSQPLLAGVSAESTFNSIKNLARLGASGLYLYRGNTAGTSGIHNYLEPQIVQSGTASALLRVEGTDGVRKSAEFRTTATGLILIVEEVAPQTLTLGSQGWSQVMPHIEFTSTATPANDTVTLLGNYGYDSAPSNVDTNFAVPNGTGIIKLWRTGNYTVNLDIAVGQPITNRSFIDIETRAPGGAWVRRSRTAVPNAEDSVRNTASALRVVAETEVRFSIYRRVGSPTAAMSSRVTIRRDGDF